MKLPPFSPRELAFGLWGLTRPELPFSIPKIQAHRGLFDSASDLRGTRNRENTLAQILIARAEGATMAEFDVRVSRDQIPIVYHDESILCKNGLTRLIQDLDLAELQSLGVSTLEEIILSKDAPEFLNIEIKSITRTLREVGFYEKSIIQTVRVAHSGSSEKKILLSSFDPLVLGAVSFLAPEYPRALIFGAKSERYKPDPLLFLPLARPHLLHLEEVLLVDPAWLALLGRHKVPFAVWTVNDPARARDLLRLGALSVISDLNLSSLL
jgi:glycerophosphoryl diester phosphodiesterase